MSTTALILIGVAIIASGVGYHFYSWLKVPPLAMQPDSSEADRIARVDCWLGELSEKFKFNGGVLVVLNGKVQLSKTYGFTDHLAARQLNGHSAFQLASVSKQFTAAGVLRLAEMGLLELDDPVANHLDGFTFERVTIRHLLNHTSGVPDDYMKLAKQYRKSIGDVLTTSKVVELINNYSKAKNAPSDIMEYSNTNYVLLAAIIEAVSGLSFEKFMSEELFQPLGMNDTRVWNLLSEERSPNQAGEYLQFGAEKRLSHKVSWLDGVAGDGSLFCSLNDFVIWDQFWYGNPLVSDELLQEAFECPRLNDGNKSDYGLGWAIEQKFHWHNGAWLGARTYIARYPESRCCVVVLDSSSNYRFNKIATQIECALRKITIGESNLSESEINV
jgi:CubicO group peptidase (beta-lactamase class C family)